ncbi:hypothetical protein niasHT_029543 [Heterodera trifolii]|uniref:Uncharacterized protein n=1 Tax=Heterodera trifolii TaxID=157864 RepID=A0ABD2JAZ0_9BILA
MCAWDGNGQTEPTRVDMAEVGSGTRVGIPGHILRHRGGYIQGYHPLPSTHSPNPSSGVVVSHYSLLLITAWPCSSFWPSKLITRPLPHTFRTLEILELSLVPPPAGMVLTIHSFVGWLAPLLCFRAHIRHRFTFSPPAHDSFV